MIDFKKLHENPYVLATSVVGAVVVLYFAFKSDKVQGWIKPLQGRISSVFGNRIHPVTKEPQFHNGIDKR